MKTGAIVIFLFLYAVLAPAARGCAEDERELFSAAYSLYAQGNLAAAKKLFIETLSPSFPLEDYSLYYLSAIHFKEKDWDASRRFLSQMRERYPGSIWFYHAELLRAKILLEEKQHPQAVEALTGLITNRSVKGEIAEEARYLLARTYEAQGNLTDAYAGYQELRELAPLSGWAAAARKGVNRLREARPELFALTTVDSLAQEAERLAKEREYGGAESLYRKILNGDLEVNLRSRFLLELANVRLAERKRSDAIPPLIEIVRDFPGSPEAPSALYRLARILWNRNENEEALVYFKRIIEHYPASPNAGMSHFAAADIYEGLGKKKEAMALYKSIPKKFPMSRLRDDALWRVAWLHYTEGDFQRARTAFRALSSPVTEDRYRMAALFWQARAAEKSGDAEGAKQLLIEIASSDEDSYYKAPAGRRLASAGVAVEPQKIDGAPLPLAPDPPSLTADLAFHLSRARELAEIALNSLAVAELDEIDRLAKPQNGLKLLLMREYARNRAYARSVAIANQLPATSEERTLYRYPLAFWGLIQRKALEKGLDPYLVLALIRQESLFDPRARSPASALGLMQLLPSTAARVAKQLGLAPPSGDQLYDPELNLTLGTQHLKDLLERYSNSRIKALAAYNAGERALDRWENEISAEDEEEFIERIPYTETRLYVKLVLRNHIRYRTLYQTPR